MMLILLILISTMTISKSVFAQSVESPESETPSAVLTQKSEDEMATWEFKTEAVAEKKKPRKPCEWVRECTDVPRPDGADHTVCWRELRCE